MQIFQVGVFTRVLVHISHQNKIVTCSIGGLSTKAMYIYDIAATYYMSRRLTINGAFETSTCMVFDIKISFLVQTKKESLVFLVGN